MLRRGAVPAAKKQADPVADRLDRWRSKMLDLTLRNRLLNFKSTRRAVAVLPHDIGVVEDALAEGRKLSVLPRAPHRPGAPDVPPDPAWLASELSGGRLHTDHTDADLHKRLTDIYRDARTSREEGGSNTLFLAIGFLQWFEAESSELGRMAPLILVPLIIHRASVAANMKVELGEDDTLLNVTLLQKLRSDFGIEVPGLEELPTDASGLDIPLILRRFREAVLKMKRWRVVEAAHIGLFSFQKHLMWQDLTARAEELVSNPLVRALLEKTSPPGGSGALLDPVALDADIAPHELLAPLDADGTQVTAIHAAAKGKTFVLEGPPGTGKSQTITNIIATAVADGRRVLFVSEKMAALEVVHRRLVSVGLGPFCLELHSSKARKREVISSFAEALDLSGARSSTGWRAHADDVARHRTGLNAYVDVIAKRRPLGLSVFHVLSRSIQVDPEAELDFKLTIDSSTWTADAYARLKETAGEFQVAANAVAPVLIHPWRRAAAVSWTPALDRAVKHALDSFETATHTLAEAAEQVEVLLGLGKPLVKTRSVLELLASSAELLDSRPVVTRALLDAPQWDVLKPQALAVVATGRTRSEQVESLAGRWEASLLDSDLGALRQLVGKTLAASWWNRWWFRGKARKALAPHATGDVADFEACADDLRTASQVITASSELDKLAPAWAPRWGALWTGSGSDWDALEASIVWTDRVRGARQAARRTLGDDAGRAWASRLVDVATDVDDLLAEGSPTRHAAQRFIAAYCAWQQELTALTSPLRMPTQALTGTAGDAIEACLAETNTLRAGLTGLRSWSYYLAKRQLADDQGLGQLVAAVEAGVIAADAIADAAEYGALEAWLEDVFEREELLRGFQRVAHEQTIARFRELDHNSLGLAGEEAVARLAARVPKADAPRGAGSELATLLRELQKKKRHKPIRALFKEMPHLLGQLKPCMMMSPLSVAQYLDPSLPPFDLVVFDEASQIPTWDAAGALGRASQAVIVGDPKQLPPTNFFQRMESDELADDGDFDELESVLDEALGCGFRTVRLGWHYRSRHESLITFSNTRYYDGRLLTFPSAQAEVPNLGVRWVHVADGVYTRGGKATNLREAERVVEDLVRRLLDPVECSRSVGIVTFSLAQRRLVEDLLDDARRRRPELEFAFAEGASEAVFVKNLENVQGDERDVILFSICYGPDATGRVGMNFGPLNRDGGERRLNVAVTRAREELVVFSTVTADHIDLSRTRAVGVQHLKQFLRYVQNGPAAWLDETFSGEQVESPLEAEVMAAIEKLGYAVDPQVGCSGYRIDLGVKDPKLPGRFLLGVECDGATYHSSKTARDRDRLRQSVLEGLGWRIHRVWSTDWWYDSDKETERLREVLSAAEREVAAQAVASPKEEPATERTAIAESDPDDVDKVSSVVSRFAEAPSLAERPDALPGASIYRAADLDPLPPFAPELLDPRAQPALRLLTEQVIRVEGPVHVGRVLRRVADAWDTRLGKKIRRTLEGHIKPACRAMMAQRAGDVIWLRGQSADSWREFRVAGDRDEDRRDAAHLPAEEIANAMGALLRHGGGRSDDELLVDAARVFGFARSGTRVRDAMQRGLDLLVQRGGRR